MNDVRSSRGSFSEWGARRDAAIAKGENDGLAGNGTSPLSRRDAGEPGTPGTNRCFRHENRDISAEGPHIPSIAIAHLAQRHTAHKCNNAGHIFLEAEETDISSAGRSSGSGSPQYAPSRLAPMAFCASLTHTAAVLSGILTPFPFDPAKCRHPRISRYSFFIMIPQKQRFVKPRFHKIVSQVN